MSRWRRCGRCRAPGLALLPVLLTGLAACTDGYPPPQREPVEPQLMSTGQLLKSLNAMGRRAAHRATWSYRLTPACELVVTIESGGSSDSTVHLIQGARFQLGYDKALSAYEVRAVARGESEPGPKPLLKATDWADAVFASSVLWHLQHDCA